MPGTSRREPRPAATRRERVRACRHPPVSSTRGPPAGLSWPSGTLAGGAHPLASASRTSIALGPTSATRSLSSSSETPSGRVPPKLDPRYATLSSSKSSSPIRCGISSVPACPNTSSASRRSVRAAKVSPQARRREPKAASAKPSSFIKMLLRAESMAISRRIAALSRCPSAQATSPKSRLLKTEKNECGVWLAKALSFSNMPDARSHSWAMM